MKNIYRKEVQRLHRRDITDLSTIAPNTDTYVRNARMHGHNTQTSGAGWRVSSRVPQKSYQPVLRDTYPRDEYTMMPQQRNAPKYYDGKFMSFDHRDMVLPVAPESSRPVVFKAQDIEKVQTRKKYGHNLKGASSVPLHICNDTSSELFQRSLNHDGIQLEYQTRNSKRNFLDLDKMRGIASKDEELPGQVDRRIKNEMSALNPLGYTTQRWIEKSFPSTTYSRTFSRRSSNSAVGALNGGLFHGQLSRKIASPDMRSEPEWYSEFFPKVKVANALKFMGQGPAVHHKAQRNREYDINFNGNW